MEVEGANYLPLFTFDYPGGRGKKSGVPVMPPGLLVGWRSGGSASVLSRYRAGNTEPTGFSGEESGGCTRPPSVAEEGDSTEVLGFPSWVKKRRRHHSTTEPPSSNYYGSDGVLMWDSGNVMCPSCGSSIMRRNII